MFSGGIQILLCVYAEVSYLSHFCLTKRVYRENLLADCLQGCFVVTCTLCAFISLVWLREQIVHGGAPLWLEQNQQQPANVAGQPNEVKIKHRVKDDSVTKVCSG